MTRQVELMVDQIRYDGLQMGYGDFDLFSELLRRIAFREGICDRMAEGSSRMALELSQGADGYTSEIKGLELFRGTS